MEPSIAAQIPESEEQSNTFQKGHLLHQEGE